MRILATTVSKWKKEVMRDQCASSVSDITKRYKKISNNERILHKGKTTNHKTSIYVFNYSINFNLYISSSKSSAY